MSGSGRDVMKANPWFWLLSGMGLDGSPVSHQQRPQTMSKGLELLSVHLIYKGDDSADLQVYYGTMAADPQCIMHIDVSWGNSTWKCNFYYCPRRRGDRDEDLLARWRISSPFTKPLLLITYTYVCVCVWLCTCARRYTWGQRTSWSSSSRQLGTGWLDAGKWGQVLCKSSTWSYLTLISPALENLLLLPSWILLVISIFPPFLIAFSAVEHYVKKNRLQ